MERIENFKNKILRFSETRLNFECSSPACNKHPCTKNAKQLRPESKTISGRNIDPFTKRHKLVHNGGFAKAEVLYFSQNTLKSIKIQ